MAELATDVRLAGWRVASDIPLPELPRWTGDDRAPEVRFEIGAVPERLETVAYETPVSMIGTDGQVIFSAPDVAEFHVTHDRVTIAPKVPVDDPSIRLFLLGSAYGFLCHLRGALPIHASTVEIDGRAVAFAGVSGAGKSTFAAAFLRRGHRIISDDVAPIVLRDRKAHVLPGPTQLRLWSESLPVSGRADEPLERCREGFDKFNLPARDAFVEDAVPLDILIHLSMHPDNGDAIQWEKLGPQQAIEMLASNLYRERALRGMLGNGEAVRRIMAAAAGIGSHLYLKRRFDIERIGDTVDSVIHTIAQLR